MRRILVIGIGAGDPDQLTLQAIKALNQVDVFFLLDKGQQVAELARLRCDLLARHAGQRPYRVVEAQDPHRDRTGRGYPAAVGEWRRRRADLYERLITDELADHQCGGFLVWGDPALYDSTIGVLDTVCDRGMVAFDYTVIPGISSVSALAARHRIGLNRVGKPVQITTGRRLSEGLPKEADDVVVMLDSRVAFRQIADDGLEIFWGAYLGTPDEILVSGLLAEVGHRVEELRAEARERKGWIMDTYLLRRTSGSGDQDDG
ncbi:MAG: precorrin-6A synthase (deacetylating) [Carbonactinosporaceae bacterium]